MSTISSVQSYGSPFFRPQAQPEREIEASPTVRGRADTPSANGGDVLDGGQPSGGEVRPPEPRLDASSVSSRLDDLIAGQVSSGRLTSDQASDLKTVFGAGTDEGEADTSGGSRDVDGRSRPPGPAATEAGADAGRTERARDTGEIDREAALDQFVQQLRQSAASGYSAGGAATKAVRPLVFDVSA